MIQFLIKLKNKRRIQKLLLSFYDEIKKNLERFYVMDQRQFIDGGFQTRCWDGLKTTNEFNFSARIIHYGSAMENFNQAFASYKEYERWYAADLKNKTPENAQKLHAQKHELDLKLKKMDDVIIPAGEELEKFLIAMNILKWPTNFLPFPNLINSSAMS